MTGIKRLVPEKYADNTMGADGSAQKSESDSKARSRNSGFIVKALAALEEGNRDKARRFSEQALEDGRLALIDAAVLVKIMERLGDTERAAKMKAATLDGMKKGLAANPDNQSIHLDAAIVLLEMDQPDEAEVLLRKAIILDPSDLRSGFPLIHRYLKRNEPDALIEVWRPFLDHEDPEVFTIAMRAMIKGMGQFGFNEHALALIEEARKKWPSSTDVLDKYERDLKGLTEDSISLTEAVDLFDSFAENYDTNLTAIGNRGPFMIGEMIEKLGWEPKGELAIFDAGCGTGLCAPYLRDHAKLLHGCDVSIKMLEKSKDRNIYDLLTRTDLNNPATYPEGVFDLAVVADVFVYFGDLVPSLSGIAGMLKPGGWVILTVEDGDGKAPARGWHSYSSGRFRHTSDYVTDALVKSGFTKPKTEFKETLRREFGEPIPGICIAAQKLALFGA